MLVNQSEARLEVYSKTDSGDWLLREAGPGEQLDLASFDAVSLDVDGVYADPLAAS